MPVAIRRVGRAGVIEGPVVRDRRTPSCEAPRSWHQEETEVEQVDVDAVCAVLLVGRSSRSNVI